MNDDLAGNPLDTTNPYRAPTFADSGELSRPTVTKLPGYVFAWAIVGLVFASLRVFMVPLSIVGMATIPEGHPLHDTVYFEIATGACYAVFGIIGNVLLLMKKPASLPFCWLMIASIVANIGVGIWQGIMQAQQFDDPAAAVGGYVGMGIVLVIRLVLLGFYTVAILRAQKLFAPTNQLAT